MKLKLREPVNGWTHFIAALFSILGLVLLLNRDYITNTIWHNISFSIFSGAMILLYVFSTLYHWLSLSKKNIQIFRRIDHIMIFIFIAATYTPVCLIVLKGAWGWSIFGVVWFAALAGLFLKLFWLNAPRFLYTLIYVLMGWIIVVGIWPLAHILAKNGLILMITGGVLYTTGALVYAFKWPNPKPGIAGFHEIFHVFIVLGSFAHYIMMYFYV